MDTLLEVLSNLALISWLVGIILGIGTGVLATLWFNRWLFKNQWRLYRNLKRPIIVLTPVSNDTPMASGDMGEELLLLESNELLNITSGKHTYRNFNPAGKHCVVVLGYKEGMDGLKEIVESVRSNHVPLIVYTYGQSLSPGQDKTILDGYSYTIYANFPMTLMSQIFSTVSCFPYEME